MPFSFLRTLDDRLVTVATHSGVPISVGRIRVISTAPTNPSAEITFRTELVSCTITLLPEMLAPLAASFNGESYRYTLPEGDRLWTQEVATRKPAPANEALASSDTASPLVETFPLPADARLVRLVTQPAKLKPVDSVAAKPNPASKPLPLARR